MLNRSGKVRIGEAMPTDVTVRPVAAKRDLRRFIRLPWKIYRGDPNWVPPLILDQKDVLNTEKNPFYKHAEMQLFMAYRGEEPVGRIGAIVDHNYISFQDDKAGFFGFFESIDDSAVSKALFEAAESWVRGKEMEHMFGPANPSTNHILGLLVDAFDRPPMVMMPYNPPYYADLIQGAGFRKIKDLYAYHMDESIPISDKIKRVTGIIRGKHNVSIRHAEKKKFERELEFIKTVYNDAWIKNWGFVPWTDEEIEHLGKDVKTIAEEDLILLAEVDGEPAGFSLSMPDVNQALKHINGRLLPFGLFKLLWHSRKINRLRTAIMGVSKKYRGMGIEAVFCYETYVRALKHGFTDGEISWVLEDNLPMRNIVERWGSVLYKTYRLYDKRL